MDESTSNECHKYADVQVINFDGETKGSCLNTFPKTRIRSQCPSHHETKMLRNQNVAQGLLATTKPENFRKCRTKREGLQFEL